MSRLKEIYNKEIVPALMADLGLKSVMSVPRIEKVVINVGIGQNKINPSLTKAVSENLKAITGQKPAIRRARKAISGFKIREGEDVGLIVTLRGERMYDFMDKLANITLPRLRDFRGLAVKSFDKDGNFSLGLKEQLIFPEISHEKAETVHGLEISFRVKNSDSEKSLKLLEKIGFPFNVVKEKNG